MTSAPDPHTRPRQEGEVLQANQMVGGWKNTALFWVMELFTATVITAPCLASYTHFSAATVKTGIHAFSF